MKILATAFDFRPRVGGVATCAFEISQGLAKTPAVELTILARAEDGDTVFDRQSNLVTKRVKLPRSSIKAVLPLALAIRREIIAHRPDFILNFLWHPCGIATWLALKTLHPSSRPRYCIFAHGVELLESDRNFRKRLRRSVSFMKRAVLQGAACVFPVSRYTAELVKKEGRVEESKIRICANGVEPDKYFPKEKRPDLIERYQLKSKTVFMSVCRLVPNKGIDEAIKAFSTLAQGNFKYLIVGDGPDKPRLEKLTKELHAEPYVQFAGTIPENELIDYYNLCDCFVLLSRTDFLAPNVEGFGIVFLEAAACGKPSIAGRSGGIPDAVQDQVTGWLVDPQNTDEISATMKNCLDHPELLRSFGAAALERVLHGFTWKHAAGRVYQTFQKLGGGS